MDSEQDAAEGSRRALSNSERIVGRSPRVKARGRCEDKGETRFDAGYIESTSSNEANNGAGGSILCAVPMARSRRPGICAAVGHRRIEISPGKESDDRFAGGLAFR